MLIYVEYTTCILAFSPALQDQQARDSLEKYLLSKAKQIETMFQINVSNRIMKQSSFNTLETKGIQYLLASDFAYQDVRFVLYGTDTG